MWFAVELVLGPLRFTSRKQCKNDHGTWGPPKGCFEAYIMHCHGPKGIAIGVAKEVLLLQMSWDHSIDIYFKYFIRFYLSIAKWSIFRMRRIEEEGRRTKTTPKILFIVTYTYIKHIIHFLVHGHYFWFMCGLHPIEAKRLVIMHFL